MTYQPPARVRVYGPAGTGTPVVLPTIGLKATWEVGGTGTLTFDALGSDLDTASAWDSVAHLEVWDGTAFVAVAPYALRRPFKCPVVAATAATSVWSCTAIGLLQKWGQEAVILPEYIVAEDMPRGAGTDRALGWESTAYDPSADAAEPWTGIYETSRTTMPSESEETGAAWPTGTGATWVSITGASDAAERKLIRTAQASPLTITAPGPIRVLCASDSPGTLYVAGEPLLTVSGGEPGKAPIRFQQADLEMGVGSFACAFDTESIWDVGGDGVDPVIIAICTLDADGDPDTWLLVTNDTDWVACRRDIEPPSNEPPGPTPGQLIRYLVEEAQARNCSGWPGVTLGFTDTHDSYSQPWSTVVVERLVRYGSDSLWSVFAALSESNECDTWLGCDLVLHAAPKQNGDTVTLDATTITSMSETLGEDEGTWAAGLALDGWVTGSQGGTRREYAMELGTAITRAVADRITAAALAENGRRDVVAKLLPIAGKMPLLDYTPGSDVTVDYCDVGTTMTVLTLTATAGEGGLDWEAELVEGAG